ncbi:TetR/AcrR family transcriptional regulator [Pseudolysinimonas sp.]|uniref:TetR/AcrR family transcriptional regulator n=1 Tax=Pseudolysinimonas sp. TaxID=2680009 RepID=UPI00286A6D25|nr:TetR/AcrR family transcriptional regulator [Pseudolysinimonas sp.]
MSIDIEPPLTQLPDAPAKLRILLTADELFYDEGIRSVGVDRLIATANVTKATFYKHYGSKDRVITAYVGYRHRQVAEEFTRITSPTDTPADALNAVRDSVLATIAAPGFRGCPFINAAAEFSDPQHPVRYAVRDHREWYATVLERLTRALGHPLPGDAADELVLARDGAMSGGYAGDPIAASHALTRTFDRVSAEAGR